MSVCTTCGVYFEPIPTYMEQCNFCHNYVGPPEKHPEAEDIKLIAFLKDQGYQKVKKLQDGTIACLQQFLFTWGVLVDVNYVSYERRFCYPTRELAEQCLAHICNSDDKPLPGYIAIK